jgi:serine/threonine protein kinase
MHWDNISSEAKDLIHRFLEKEPEKRITLENALNHKWFDVHFIKSQY